jgi:acrylyl-CoA reductase (NADPH)
MKYTCLVADETQKKCLLTERSFKSLGEGEVLIKSAYSGLNYKDALGVTFSAPIYKKNLIVPGIDVSGVVFKSRSKKFKEGDSVIVHGMGLGESFDGGFSEFVQVDENVVVPLPKGLSLKQAMILGTSGFTAALAVARMIQNGQVPDHGPILVSGASGGVGQVAVQILNQLGFFVEAVTSKKTKTDFLESLGAHLVTDLESLLNESSKPLEKVVWGGAVDNLGGSFLEFVLPRIELWGNVASVGLAQTSGLKTSVMPFILRGVSLLGASSNNTPMWLRHQIWKQLSEAPWKPKHLDQMLNSEIELKDVVTVSGQLIANQHSGKTIVKI